MGDSVREECKHIARGDLAQNELRMIYSIVRQHHLARATNPPPAIALEEAVRSVRGRHPGFVPEYDEAYFRTTLGVQNEAEAKPVNRSYTPGGLR